MKKIKNAMIFLALVALPVVVFDCDLLDLFMGDLM
jgi:hypothetical protein